MIRASIIGNDFQTQNGVLVKTFVGFVIRIFLIFDKTVVLLSTYLLCRTEGWKNIQPRPYT